MKTAVFAAPAVLVLAGCGATQPTKPHVVNAVQPADQLAKARRLIAARDWPDAIAVLRALIEAESFGRLPADLQYRTLALAGRTALYHGSPQLAYDYWVRVTDMPQAAYEDWLGRLQAADKASKTADSIIALTVLVRRWPDRSLKFNPDYILHLIGEAKHSEAELPLLQALYDAHWKLRGDIEPSAVWRDLALRLLDEGRAAEASDVARRVTDVYVLIAMRADRRFDRIVAVNAAQFDIERAADREFEALQSAAENSPRSLELKSRVIEVLLARQRYEAALAAADSTLLDISSTNYPEKLYEDFGDEQSWFLNLRAIALERVGRFDEAVAQLTAASQLHEKYSGNVDQLINLADLYCALERPKDALSSLTRMVARASPYGAMQLEAVRLDAYVQLKDAEQAARSLQYLRSHRADDPSSYEDGLLVVNQPAGAAAELVRRLLDKDLRQDALLGVQDFAPTPGTRHEMELDARRRALVSRAEVRAAIDRVGRVESYRLEAP